MKILFLSQAFPYPPDRGDRIKAFNLLKYLSRWNSVHLVSFHQAGDDLEKGNHVLRDYCATIDLYPTRSPDMLHLLASGWRYAFGARPFFLRRYIGTALERDLPRLVARYQPDVAHLDLLGMTVFRPHLAGYPQVVGCSDALHIAAERDAQLERHTVRRAYLWHQAKALKEYERWVLPAFARCIFVGPEDNKRMKRLAPTLQATLIPNGIDVDYVRPLGLSEEYPTLIFTGYMGGGQNIDAVEHFCQSILPTIRRAVPEVKFVVAGRDPTPRVRELGHEHSFTVTGAVPDMRPYLDTASVYVCPVRGGTGFKNRLAEAMAMGKPIVATRVSAAGLEEAKNGEHLFLADEPAEFARQVVLLLRDPDLRRRMGTEARRLVERSYDWEHIARRYHAVYEEVRQAYEIDSAGIAPKFQTGPSGS